MARRPALHDLYEFQPDLEKLELDAGVSLKPSACIRRLPESYLAEFSTETIATHVVELCSISNEKPFRILLEPSSAGVSPISATAVTVFAFDVEGMLGLLTGILGVSGFDIQGGSVYTLLRDAPAAKPGQVAAHGRRRRPNRSRTPTVIPTRRIVDRFECVVPEGRDLEELRQGLEAFLGRVLPEMLPGRDRELARRMVNEAVADQLRSDDTQALRGLLPVDVDFEVADKVTRMTIVGEDTPFFLYSLSTALSLQGVSIEGVEITTERHVIRDTLELVDRSGEPIRDRERLDRIRLSVLLTKQFTYFLGGAPDPYNALVRFESMSDELVAATEREGIASALSQPLILRELARLLGASDFLWEDFIRGQYESLLPMLDKGQSGFSTPHRDLARKLNESLDEADDFEQKKRVLNEFKDTENFLIDLDHILQAGQDFFFLSNKLSDLAETIVAAAFAISWARTTERYGVPRSVAGLPAEWAVFALGKLGGRAIGYASDLELLFIYSDNGETDGSESVSNAEFFERFVAEASGCIESKREGIFQVDLRLRPHGNSGPHAVSLESFNRYYGRDGEAHSYEKLALTRLRCVTGDEALGSRVEQLRDELIYSTDSIDLAEIRELREKQLKDKTEPGRLNAKFSPGGLVDLEYGLQIILVQHGRANPGLRTTSLHSGLEELSRLGLMENEEAERLVRAYRFLRNLINGLRMLRGNAQDLFLPDAESLEFGHLARRTGYVRVGDLSPSEQLQLEFEARTAAVRAFIEHHLGRDSIPGRPPGTAADLVYSGRLDENLAAAIASKAGLGNPDRAITNVRSLAGTGERRDVFSELIGLAWTSLTKSGDPDMALNNWERYVSNVGDAVSHFRSLLKQPAKLELMLQVFATSQFLAEILIRMPAFLEWALDRAVVASERTSTEMLADLRNELRDDGDRRAVLRLFRQREILRIGTRDICLEVSIETITREISALAIAVVHADLEQIWKEARTADELREGFCILAFGKLGGHELNYSSDIDLLGVCEDRFTAKAELFATALETLRNDLSSVTEHGHAFRVDFRLRPHGSSGALVQGLSAVATYYQETALPWENQALIKLSPIAGNLELGNELLNRIKPAWVNRWDRQTVVESIAKMRVAAVNKSRRRGDDVKSGEGGIRDVEFTVQGLQMVHSATYLELLTGNTFTAIRVLAQCGIVSADTAERLLDHYILLRRVEHFLQIYEDRQVHSLPSDTAQRQAVARRLAGGGGDGMEFLSRLEACRRDVRSLYEQFLAGGDLK